MVKRKFLDNGGNYTSKGMVKDCLYEISERKESQTIPGKFMCSVTGPGLTKPINMWEDTITKEFAPAEKVIQQTMNLNPEQESVMKTPELAGAKIHDPNAAPKVTAEQVLNAVQAVDKRIAGLQSIQNLAAIQAQKVAVEAKDLLLSELLKLDFLTLNIKLIKADGKVSMVIVMDGMPPFAINSKDVSAESVVSAITATFSEQAMIISTIKEYKKAITELLAAKEKEAKEAAKPTPAPKVEAVKADTVKTRRTAAEKANAPVVIVESGDEEPEPDPVGEPEEADFSQERAAGGITQEVADFSLTDLV